MPFRLDPQVAGELGGGTVLDSSTHPPKVTQVDFILDQPDADELIQSFPVFLVSEHLGARLQAASLTGFTLTGASVRPSENYLAAYGNTPHRRYKWMQVTGVAGQADCWLGETLQLCVSDPMMVSLRTARLTGCVVEALSP